MPGILGVIRTTPPAADNAEVACMLKCMTHAPSYVSGSYRNDDVGIHVGWLNHPGSFSDCMPVWNEQKDVCLIFSGEDFADHSLVSSLQAAGHLCSAADARYLVHAYEEWGTGFLSRINGWFSGILIDLRKNTVIVFNDRYGLGRVYWHQTSGTFYFASEAKALLKVCPSLRDIDEGSLGELLSCGCVLGNRTLFRGVSLLPAAAMWTFDSASQVRKQTYFDHEQWENAPRLDAASYYEALRDTFARVLPRYFGGPRRVGVSLTGGLDSRMIMAWGSCHPYKVPTFSFCGPYRDCADVVLARRVAKTCQQHHETIYLNKRFFADFPALAKKAVYYSDGTMDVTGGVELHINQQAKQIAPVRLTGNYGDEVLRSAVALKPGRMDEAALAPEFIPHMQAGAERCANEVKDRSLSVVLQKQVPWYHYARFSVEQSQLTMRSPYLDNDLVSVAFQAPPELEKSVDIALRLIAEGNPALGRFATDRGHRANPVPLLTRAHSLLQAFTFKAEYAYDYGMPQWVAKTDHALERLRLERLFLGRHKFTHFRVWYRDLLANYIRDILLCPRAKSRPHIRGAGLEKIVTEHTAGRCNYTSEIHRLLSIELMWRQLIDD